MSELKTPNDLGGIPVPASLQVSIAKAKARTLRRSAGPPIEIVHDADGKSRWTWPFAEAEEDDADWRWLILDAFGTRVEAVAAAFMTHLAQICASTFDHDLQRWVPDGGELIAMVNVVRAHHPRDEAEAALAAQMAMTHVIMMRVGKQVADHPYDTRTIGAFANLAKASATQFEAMASTKGKRRTSRQTITVRQEKHVHEHKHVHLEQGGGGSNGDGQSHASILDDRTARNGDGTPLPRSDKSRDVVPIRGCAR